MDDCLHAMLCKILLKIIPFLTKYREQMINIVFIWYSSRQCNIWILYIVII